MRLILASASPRRAELLAAAGFVFEVRPVDVDERVRDHESAADYVCRLASEKSRRAMEISVSGSPELLVRRSSLEPMSEGGKLGPTYDRTAPHDRTASVDGVVVLAADTAVIVDGRILGKPPDDDDARQMLRLLSGRSHEVMTGVSVRSAVEELGAMDTTTVWFGPLTDRDIAWYVGTGEGRDKAGAYAIQGLASRFIPRISGSYANVVGLPVALVAELLGRLKEV
jgi:septum formation protein